MVLDLHEFCQYKIDDMTEGKPKFAQITEGKLEIFSNYREKICHEVPKSKKHSNYKDEIQKKILQKRKQKITYITRSKTLLT